MADFYFFTDIDRLTQQTSEQAFGPFEDTVNFPDKDCYRVTSKHILTEDSLAYAVCKGKVLVQQDNTNPLLVNVILKPELQPTNCPPVKFFVYRGIKKDSLISSNTITADSCTLTYSINNSYTDAPMKILGVELIEIPNYDALSEEEKELLKNYPNNSMIESIFYESFEDFELWTVNEGWSIGLFDKDNAGFEIMLDTLGFNPTLELVRNTENILTVTSLTGSETEADTFNHWHKKETILHYIDPTAFYGNFYKEIIKARTSLKEIDDKKIPIFDKYKKDEIYTEILNGTNGNFLNRNNIYLDIRNEFNMSFNYFSNYGNDLKISYVDDNNEPETIISYKANNWSLLILTDLPDGNEENTIKIAFPIGDNTLPLIYVKVGTRYITNVEKIKQGKSRFMELTLDTESLFTTNSLVVNTPNVNNDTNTRISSYLRILYLKRFDSVLEAPESSESVLRRSHFRDMIFCLGNMNIPFTGTESLKIKVFDDNVYIDSLTENGTDYMAKIGIAQDMQNTYFFIIKNDLRTKNRFKMNNNPFSLSSGIYNTNAQFLEFAFGNNYYKEEITVGLETGFIIQYIKRNIKDYFSSSNEIDMSSEAFIIIISNQNYELLQTVLEQEFTEDYPVYLALQKTNETEYYSYELLLQGITVQNDEVISKFIQIYKDSDTL